MFPQKISQNIDILARIHGNVFPWQPTIMGNKASYYKSMFQISLLWLYLSFHNACPRHLKSRRDLLYLKIITHRKNFPYNSFRVYLMCMPNFRAIVQLFFRLQSEKRPEIGNFRDFWSTAPHKFVILHPKMAPRAMKFFLGITNSPLKEIQPTVHTSLQYHGNVSSPKTDFEVVFFRFLTFECNFWYLECSDLDEILHGSST